MRVKRVFCLSRHAKMSNEERGQTRREVKEITQKVEEIRRHVRRASETGQQVGFCHIVILVAANIAFARLASLSGRRNETTMPITSTMTDSRSQLFLAALFANGVKKGRLPFGAFFDAFVTGCGCSTGCCFETVKLITRIKLREKT